MYVITYSRYTNRTLFGAPLGGWSRANRSRLASLPLRLVGNSVFWKNENGESDENGNENDAETHRIAGSGSPYFTMSDGIGRKFVCHIYDQDDLTQLSLSQSVFDAPILKNIDILEDEEDDEEDEETDEEGVKKSESDVDIDSGLADSEGNGDDKIERNADDAEGVEENTKIVLTHNLDDYLEGRGIEALANSKLDTGIYNYQLDAKPILENLKELQGTCAALHTGWWSYEWCDTDKITQFHVQLQGNEYTEVVTQKDLMPEFVLQSISTIGKHTDRKIVVQTTDSNLLSDAVFNGNAAGDEGITVEAGISKLVVVDSFEDGEYCEDIDEYRKVEVRLKCCTQTDIVTSLRKGAMQNLDFFTQPFTKESDQARAILLNVQERSVCNYVAHVCTNVLCDTWLEGENSDIAPSRNPNADNVEFQRDDSIRYILDKTFVEMGERCLKRNEGWWSYKFCYKGAISQFHESFDLDADRGVMKALIESENTLGIFDPVAAERYPNEDEVQYVVFPQGIYEEDAKSGTESTPTPQTSGLESAYFYQEYTSGDVCEGEDVIDSAIKGGEMGEGVIQRSTTVRYFCGDKRELIKINEDHTCHYIIDISVPELCSHKFFEIQHIDKHAVKCMPVA